MVSIYCESEKAKLNSAMIWLYVFVGYLEEFYKLLHHCLCTEENTHIYCQYTLDYPLCTLHSVHNHHLKKIVLHAEENILDCLLYSSVGSEPKLGLAWLGFGSSFWEKKLSLARLAMPSKKLGSARLAISCRKARFSLAYSMI